MVTVLQLIKVWIVQLCAHDGFLHYNTYFDLQITLNHGIAFGWLAGKDQQYTLMMTTFLILTMIYWFFYETSVRMRTAMMLVIAGGCSNMIDRSIHGAVIDYFFIHYDSFYFPIFNLADILITTGASMMITISGFTNTNLKQIAAEAA